MNLDQVKNTMLLSAVLDHKLPVKPHFSDWASDTVSAVLYRAPFSQKCIKLVLSTTARSTKFWFSVSSYYLVGASGQAKAPSKLMVDLDNYYHHIKLSELSSYSAQQFKSELDSYKQTLLARYCQANQSDMRELLGLDFVSCFPQIISNYCSWTGAKE